MNDFFDAKDKLGGRQRSKIEECHFQYMAKSPIFSRIRALGQIEYRENFVFYDLFVFYYNNL